jgi:uncharacterized protein involved in outer membrane biogenesis
VVGSLTKPASLAALDMRLKVSGPSMARLYGLTGVLLPETPPFATEGHLTGNIGANASHWVYDQFTGKVGGSDIAGKLDYKSGRPRPVLTGAVQSKLLQFTDLGPLIGADSKAGKEARGVENVQPGNRVLPVETFRTERWTALDADVSFKAARITRDKDLPITNLDTLIHMKDGVLSLTPMNFDIAGGSFTSNVMLDGSGKINANAIRAELKAGLRQSAAQAAIPQDRRHAGHGRPGQCRRLAVGHRQLGGQLAGFVQRRAQRRDQRRQHQQAAAGRNGPEYRQRRADQGDRRQAGQAQLHGHRFRRHQWR